MPQLPPSIRADYLAVLSEARRGSVTLTRAALLDLDRLYARLVADIVLEASSATPGTAERLTRRSGNLRRALARVRARIEALETDAQRAARIMGDGHTEAVDVAVARARPGFRTSVSFESVPERAVEALMRRRQIAQRYGVRSYAGLFRSIATTSSERVLASVDDALVKGLARGADARDVARQIALDLTEGRPDVRAAVERLSGSLQRSGPTLSARATRAAGLTDELSEARQLLSRARRIARTEILSAQMEADRLAQHESPVVAATRWTLSGNHPETGCACEVFARTDLYDLGVGVFPTNAVPSRPHPHCGCFLRAVTRGPSEWDTPKVRAGSPASLDEYPFQRRADGRAYTSTHRERVRRNVNQGLARAIQGGAPPGVPPALPPAGGGSGGRRREFEALRASDDYRSDVGYFDETSGGYAAVHVGHDRNSVGSNLETARYFTAPGGRVLLLDERGAARTPDVRLLDEPGSPVAEFKRLQPQGSAENSVYQNLRAGRKQAGVVALRFVRVPDFDEVNAGITAAIRRDLEKADEFGTQPRLRRIVLLFTTDSGPQRLDIDADDYNPGATLRSLLGGD